MEERTQLKESERQVAVEVSGKGLKRILCPRERITLRACVCNP